MPAEVDVTASRRRLLVVDDRPHEAAAWTASARLEDDLSLRCVGDALALRDAVLDGGWDAVLCHQAPAKLSLSAVLAMTQVLEPAPAVLLYPSTTSSDDRARWLQAALSAVPHAAGHPSVHMAPLDVGSAFGHVGTNAFSSSDVEAKNAGPVSTCVSGATTSRRVT